MTILNQFPPPTPSKSLPSQTSTNSTSKIILIPKNFQNPNYLQQFYLILIKNSNQLVNPKLPLMKKPQDSDIFGTKSLGFAPRITNPDKTDPNQIFQNNMDLQFQSYTKKIGTINRINSGNNYHPTKVNQQANFDQNYHRERKQADLQSTIFYQPSVPPTNPKTHQRPKITQRIVPKHAYHVTDTEYNFGKKQTLTREVKALPQNKTNFKGNSSNIFGYDSFVERNQVKGKIGKLIPHQMQWTDHDSIRHQDYPQPNHKIQQLHNQLPPSHHQTNQLPLKSTLQTKQQPTPKITQLQHNDPTSNQNDIKVGNIIKKNQMETKNPEEKHQKQLKKQKPKQLKQPKPSQPQNVQISILKGWSSNIMEELSKCCKLNTIKVLSVNFQEGGKGHLIINRGKRWETIVDWLRKDAKLKIRVMN